MAKARVVLIPDGMADEPIEALGGATPLEKAASPCMDSLAVRGGVGLSRNVPEGMEPGSDVAIMSIMGYDPAVCYTGRGPLEAVSMGIPLDPGQAAFRCNLIYIEGDLLVDYSAEHITTEESGELIAALDAALSSDIVKFHHGISFRNVMTYRGDIEGLASFAPHDHMDEPWEKYLPTGGPAEAALLDLMARSRAVLEDHPVNKARRSAGKRPANMIWPWSGGPFPRMEPFEKKYGLRGAVISAVDLVQGLGKAAGMDVIKVPGATGMLDTNYEGKAEAAVRALDTHDIVFVHVEATDEVAHTGNINEKIQGIEFFDSRIARPIVEALEKRGDYALLLLPDHPTPIRIRTHTSEPVPFIAVQSGGSGNGATSFTEAQSAGTGLLVEHGHELIGKFISGEIFTTK